jgi:hypothetical protein
MIAPSIVLAYVTADGLSIEKHAAYANANEPLARTLLDGDLSELFGQPSQSRGF